MRAKLRQYKVNLWKRLENDSNGYYGILHDLRNFYFDLLSYHKRKELNKNFLTSITRNYLTDLLDKLCCIYSAYTGSTINACIKLIGKQDETVNFDTIRLNDATVYTFVRSRNITKQREDISDNTPVLINKNTDFSYIIEPPDFYQKQYFYEQNLHLFDEKLKKYQEKYENTTKNYWNFYRAALVVPIRISHAHLYFTEPSNDYDYHIVGFLCVDTMSTQAFIPEYEEPFIKIAKSFSAIIYLIMNKYNFYLKKCNKSLYKKSRRSKNVKGDNDDAVKTNSNT